MPTLLAEIVRPTDANVVNVLDYGAVPDGVTDSTAAFVLAIQAAVSNPSFSTNFGHELYIPPGKYIISDMLDAISAGGVHGACLTIQGAGMDYTELRLPNATAGFTNANSPKPLIRLASQGSLSSNTGFRNSIKDLTITIGGANPGAVGADINVSNTGGASNICIRTVDSNRIGSAGLKLTRAWPGPAYFDNIIVEGFQYGIDVGQFQYSLVFEHIELRNQTVAGFRNSENVVVVRDLKSEQIGNVPAVLCTDVDGVFTLLDLDASTTSSSGGAIDNSVGAHLYVRDPGECTGYTYKLISKDGTAGTIVSYDRGKLPAISEFITGEVSKLHPGQTAASLRLPVMEPQYYHDTDLDNWANVEDFGATRGNSSTDQAPFIQAALDSGASTIYFPASPGGQTVTNNIYVCKTPLTIPPTVKCIIGFHAVLQSSDWTTGNFWTVEDGTDDLLYVFGLIHGSTSSGMHNETKFTDAILTEDSPDIEVPSASFTSSYVGRSVLDYTGDGSHAFPIGTDIDTFTDGQNLVASNPSTVGGVRTLRFGSNVNTTGGLKGNHWWEHSSRRPVTMRECVFGGQNMGAYFRSGCGPVHLVSTFLSFENEEGVDVWVRGHNMEDPTSRRTVNKGTLWALGYKTERYGCAIRTEGGDLELFGGFLLPTGADVAGEPGFECIDGRQTLNFSAFAYQAVQAFHEPVIRETWGATTLDLAHSATLKRINGWTDVVVLHVGRLR